MFLLKGPHFSNIYWHKLCIISSACCLNHGRTSHREDKWSSKSASLSARIILRSTSAYFMKVCQKANMVDCFLSPSSNALKWFRTWSVLSASISSRRFLTEALSIAWNACWTSCKSCCSSVVTSILPCFASHQRRAFHFSLKSSFWASLMPQLLLLTVSLCSICRAVASLYTSDSAKMERSSPSPCQPRKPLSHACYPSSQSHFQAARWLVPQYLLGFAVNCLICSH